MHAIDLRRRPLALVATAVLAASEWSTSEVDCVHTFPLTDSACWGASGVDLTTRYTAKCERSQWALPATTSQSMPMILNQSKTPPADRRPAELAGAPAPRRSPGRHG